jgi:hypothetical protein
MGIPFCELTVRATCALRRSSASASLSIAFARCPADQLRQPSGLSNADLAAATAASTSARVPSGTEPNRCSSLGDTTVITASVAGLTH